MLTSRTSWNPSPDGLNMTISNAKSGSLRTIIFGRNAAGIGWRKEPPEVKTNEI
jgi:hypothetical protein